jgi:hypothetical protein
MTMKEACEEDEVEAERFFFDPFSTVSEILGGNVVHIFDVSSQCVMPPNLKPKPKPLLGPASRGSLRVAMTVAS